MQANSFSVPLYNLVDTLFGDPERFSERAQGFARAVTRPDLGISHVFFRRVLGHWIVWKKDPGIQLDHHAARGIAQLLEYGRVVIPPVGHRLPHAFTLDGSFIFTLEEAISCLVNRLYGDLLLPTSPQSQATPKQVERNAEISAKYKAGISVPDLSREYNISTKRVYQILRGKRK